ncbi:unnamed protein product, partial [Linum tenue]
MRKGLAISRLCACYQNNRNDPAFGVLLRYGKQQRTIGLLLVFLSLQRLRRESY